MPRHASSWTAGGGHGAASSPTIPASTGVHARQGHRIPPGALISYTRLSSREKASSSRQISCPVTGDRLPDPTGLPGGGSRVRPCQEGVSGVSPHVWNGHPSVSCAQPSPTQPSGNCPKMKQVKWFRSQEEYAWMWRDLSPNTPYESTTPRGADDAVPFTTSIREEVASLVQCSRSRFEDELRSDRQRAIREASKKDAKANRTYQANLGFQCGEDCELRLVRRAIACARRLMDAEYRRPLPALASKEANPRR
eukprot:scaffold6348_cov259-Pinguiococcus_pyrenoidosus.AAC.18